MPSEPGPFGWIGNLTRWANNDVKVAGQGGPLPPPKAKATDPTEHELYQGLADGWLHGTVGAALSSFFSEPRTRKELYVLFEKMDMTDIMGSFLDLVAEDATQPDPETGRLVWVEGPDAIVEACDEMFKRLKYEDEISGISRDIAKFGDNFERLVYSSGPEGGIRRLIPVPPIMVTRKEDKEGRLQGYIQVGKRFRNDNSEMSYAWDFVHYRLRGRDRRYPYGTSMLHNAIRPWKQCQRGSGLVWTDRGPVAIRDIKVGDKVACHDPETKETTWTKVTAHQRTGRKLVYKVTTAHRSVEFTDDHEFLTVDAKGSHRYKQVKDLLYPSILKGGSQKRNAQSDYLVLPVMGGSPTVTLQIPTNRLTVAVVGAADPVPGFKALWAKSGVRTSYKNAHRWAFYGKGHRIPADDANTLSRIGAVRPGTPMAVYVSGGRYALPGVDTFGRFTVGADFARLLGFMLGDGWLCASGHGAGWADSVYPERNDYYIRLSDRIFGSVSTVADAKVGAGGTHAWQTTAAAEILSAAGFVSGFANKVVPAWLFSASLEIKRAFLQGMADADGYEQSGGWVIGLSNKALILGVRMLAQQAGMRVSRELTPNGYVGKEGPHRKAPWLPVPVQRKESYKIFVSPAKDTDSLATYERVTSVTPAGEDDVYDITVESSLHNFVADGVVVHNCIILEDWMIGYQINRHPDRNMVMLDIGTASDVEAGDVARRFRQKLKRHMIIDPGGTTQRGNTSYTHDPLTPMEDLVLPVRTDSNTRIEKLAGSANAVDMGPLQYVMDKIYAALRAPKAFFGIDYSNGMPMNMKASLTNQDVRYARGVKRLQRASMAGTRYLCELNLMLLMSPGSNPAAQPDDKLKSVLDWRLDGQDFTVKMGPVSYLDELERLEVEQLRQQVALAMLELGANNPAIDVVRWSNYVLREVVKVPEADLDEILNPEMDTDTANALRFNQPQMSDQTADPNQPPPPQSDQAKKQQESRRRTLRAVAGDSSVSEKEKAMLAEALSRSGRLRETIAFINRRVAATSGRHGDDGEMEGIRSIGANLLPDRDNELFRKGLLKDALTEADLKDALGEAVEETR